MNTTDFEPAFVNRHIGPTPQEQQEMLDQMGLSSVEQLLSEVVPQGIRTKEPAHRDSGWQEPFAQRQAQNLAAKNKVQKSFIGLGYYGTHTPEVIKRNVLENPGWYTQYTPYQPEIAQGRLESLLNFQTMIADLTGLPMANASLLDEATAAAEALILMAASTSGEGVFFVSQDCFPQTIDVVTQRAEALGFSLTVGDHRKLPETGVRGLLLQNPTATGELLNYTGVIKKAQDQGALVAVCADILSLVGVLSPGSMGADICIGSSQRFGIPMGFGGPHAGFIATKDAFKRKLPGRIVGVSQNVEGENSYRLTLQTREQHIRRDKATSNICTAQALLANMAAFYAIYHGYEGLFYIFNHVHALTRSFNSFLDQRDVHRVHRTFFDRLTIVATEEEIFELYQGALSAGFNLWQPDARTLSINFDETTTEEDVEQLKLVFADVLQMHPSGIAAYAGEPLAGLQRKDKILSHPVFHRYRTETQLMRYIKQLENRDLSLLHAMIPLGSCTMKLNAATELAPLSMEGLGNIHPFAPAEQTAGYLQLIKELKEDLCRITGFADVSLQPNSGAQGEYAGLLVIKAYLAEKGEKKRHICLIPQSAHGTNPASAAMAGFKIVVVLCDDRGNIDLVDLKSKAALYRDELACLMLTYPSTHGVFEESVQEVCKTIHDCGGQVYLDGANFNAMVEVCRPGEFGADLCHINLHKTFCIPHGGGGPGAGPIAVASHLKDFLPGHALVETGGKKAIRAVSAAPYGSSLLYVISWLYIKMMGPKGLRQATETAILNANYMAHRLKDHYPILYTNQKGRVAHELILDLRSLAKESGVECHDIAKRLMDFSFHAPTVSFPVAQTLMIEPTESESKEEMDRYCEALIHIKGEILKVLHGIYDKGNNPLKNAPHTEGMLLRDIWDRPYTREQAAYPLPWVKKRKFWPKSSRIDEAYGDRNVFCVCPDVLSST